MATKTDDTCTEFIKNLRVEKACTVLEAPTVSIKITGRRIKMLTQVIKTT